MGQLIRRPTRILRLGRKEMLTATVTCTIMAKNVFDELISTHPEREVQFDLQRLAPARGDGA